MHKSCNSNKLLHKHANYLDIMLDTSFFITIRILLPPKILN